MGNVIKRLGWKRLVTLSPQHEDLLGRASDPNASGLSRKHVLEGSWAALCGACSWTTWT